MSAVFDIHVRYGRATLLRDGVVAFGPTTLAQAEVRRDALIREARMKLRPCITCRTEFRSEGPHHRMCQRCRKGGGAEDYGII
jgi:Zn finger protein HypA/HybF involved in hydrogenase expression